MEDNRYIEGIVFKADEVTKNGLIYTSESLRKAVDDWNDNELEHKHFGMLYHKEYEGRNMFNRPIDRFTLQFDQVSHSITELKFEDDKVIATVKILQTPQGNILKIFDDIDNAVKFMPIMTGTVDEDKVVTNIRFVRVDIGSKDDIDVTKIED